MPAVVISLMLSFEREWHSFDAIVMFLYFDAFWHMKIKIQPRYHGFEVFGICDLNQRRLLLLIL